jgi:hypothetical protein
VAHVLLPEQPVLALGTVQVEGRTVTLSDRLGAAEATFLLRFESDSTFTGTWAVGPDGGTLAGRRGADPALLPSWPPCAGGPGDLPLPAPGTPPAPDPEAARFVTSDVALFWEVLDSTPAQELALGLHCGYLREGTDALRDFIPLRIGSGEALAQAVEVQRERYEAVRESSLAMAALEPEIRATFRALQALYPGAVFPDVHFVMGRFNTGGTISQRGLLIGAEMYPDPSGVAAIVAHELIHFQQRPIPADQRTLLAQSILEGSADFLAELIWGDHINPQVHAYALPRERALWEEFSQVMHGADVSGWLYGDAPGGRPADLGYFFGYRIAEAYFAGAGAGRQAIHDILNITDFAGFLEGSGYDP